MTRLRKLRSVFLGFLAFALTVGILSGCGKSGNAPEDEEEAGARNSRSSSLKSDRDGEEAVERNSRSSSSSLKAKLDGRKAEEKEEEARRKAAEEQLQMAQLKADRIEVDFYAHFGRPCRPALLRFLGNIASPTELKTDLPLDPNLTGGFRSESDELDDLLFKAKETSPDKEEEKTVFDPGSGRVVLAFDEDTLRGELESICDEVRSDDEEDEDDEDDYYSIPEDIRGERDLIFTMLFKKMITPPEVITSDNREAFREAAAEKFAKAFAIFRRDVQELTMEDVTDSVARELFLDALGLPREMRQDTCRSYLETITRKYLASDLIPGLSAHDTAEKQRLVQEFVYGALNPRMMPPADQVIPIIRNIRIKEDLFRRLKDSGVASLDSMSVRSLIGAPLECNPGSGILAYSYELELTGSTEEIDAFVGSLRQAYDSGFVYVVAENSLHVPKLVSRVSSHEEKKEVIDSLVRKRMASPGKAKELADPDSLPELLSLIGDARNHYSLKIDCLYDPRYDISDDGDGDGLDAESLLERANDGDPAARELLALCCSHGIGGVEADPAEAEKWRKTIREAEIEEAFQLGRTYFACEANLKTAAGLLKKAADSGNAEAKRLLEKTEEELHAAEEILIAQTQPDKLRPEDDANSNGIPDEWEKKYALTETDAGSDQDGDGFTLKDEFAAETDPADPLSHPKYITRICVDGRPTQPRFTGLRLTSVDMSKPDKKSWEIKFSTQVLSGNSVVKKNPLVKIGGSFRSIDSKKKNVDFVVVDIELDEEPQEPVVYIQRVGNQDERIPCRKGQNVYDPQQSVKFKSALPLWSWNGSCKTGEEFTLGSEKTGAETYRFVSVDLKTREAVVETVGGPRKTFTIPPSPEETTVAPANGDKEDNSPFLQRR